MVKVKNDLTGWKQPNGKLTVIQQVDDYIYPNGKKSDKWLCQCECGEFTIVLGARIKNETTKSCGCYNKESHKKFNTYDLSGEYGIGWSSNTNEPFYFDLEDYEVIKDHCWRVQTIRGYRKLTTWYKGKTISLHAMLGHSNCDHADRNPLNNRKSNLRTATNSENAQNRSVFKNNNSGVTGVCWMSKSNQWYAYLIKNKERILSQLFNNKEDAIKARLRAEAKYLKEFAPQKHLFEQYGIKIEEEC